MSKLFIGLALADSMFGENVRVIERTVITPAEMLDVLNGEYESCVNPSHQATLVALWERFGIDIRVPGVPPKIEVKDHGDSIIVIGVRGLPRLTDRHEYTDEEVALATFKFTRYTVSSGWEAVGL